VTYTKTRIECQEEKGLQRNPSLFRGFPRPGG
jgi:hypothetical protein